MLNLFNWRDKKWRKPVMAVLTVVVLLVIVSHPELRLLFPLVDALGVDVLVTLLSVQFLSLFGDYVKPSLCLLYRNVMLPLLDELHEMFMYFSGSFGHYLTVRIYDLNARVFPGLQFGVAK